MIHFRFLKIFEKLEVYSANVFLYSYISMMKGIKNDGNENRSKLYQKTVEIQAETPSQIYRSFCLRHYNTIHGCT